MKDPNPCAVTRQPQTGPLPHGTPGGPARALLATPVPAGRLRGRCSGCSAETATRVPRPCSSGASAVAALLRLYVKLAMRWKETMGGQPWLRASRGLTTQPYRCLPVSIPGHLRATVAVERTLSQRPGREQASGQAAGAVARARHWPPGALQDLAWRQRSLIGRGQNRIMATVVMSVSWLAVPDWALSAPLRSVARLQAPCQAIAGQAPGQVVQDALPRRVTPSGRRTDEPIPHIIAPMTRGPARSSRERRATPACHQPHRTESRSVGLRARRSERRTTASRGMHATGRVPVPDVSATSRPRLVPESESPAAGDGRDTEHARTLPNCQEQLHFLQTLPKRRPQVQASYTRWVVVGSCSLIMDGEEGRIDQGSSIVPPAASAHRL